MADRRVELVNRRAVVTISGATLIAPLVATRVQAQAPDRAAVEAALAEMQDIASRAPDAPSILNKLNRDGSNVEDAEALREAIGADKAANVNFTPTGTGAVVEPVETTLQRLGIYSEQHGEGFDGTADDGAAFASAVDAVLALHTANPTYSLKAKLASGANSIVNLPGGASAFGVGRIDFEGVAKMAAAADYLEIGLNSVLGFPTRYDIAEVSTGYVRIVGVMNGDVRIGRAPKVEWWADSSVASKKSSAYTYAHYGDVPIIEINGIDGDGVGGASPFINSIRHFTQRVEEITFQAGYPHNMHFFDCMGSDSLVATVNAGHSIYFEDLRGEAASTLTFAAGTFNCYAVNAYYGFADAYFRRVAYGLHTVANSGKSNELVEKLDAHFDQKELWAVHANSKNYDVSRFARGAVDLICVGNNQVIFDTGVFPLKNALGLYVEADAAEARFLSPFVYFYNAAGGLIMTDPGGDIISLVNGGWNTKGDPLGLNYHYRTSAPVENTTVSLFPKSGSGVAFCRVVLRTGGAVDGTVFRSLRVVLTEAKKYNTKMPLLRPVARDAFFSTVTQSATAVPCTAGAFTAGETVLAANVPGTAAPELGAAASKYVLRGWDRMTTGSGHVLNTDWRQRRDLTGN